MSEAWNAGCGDREGLRTGAIALGFVKDYVDGMMRDAELRVEGRVMEVVLRVSEVMIHR